MHRYQLTEGPLPLKRLSSLKGQQELSLRPIQTREIQLYQNQNTIIQAGHILPATTIQGCQRDLLIITAGLLNQEAV